MVETERNLMLTVGRDGALHVPLDVLRSVTFQTKNFISGEFPGSGYMAIASGKTAYIAETIINVLSGIYPATLKWADAATAQSGYQVSGNAYIVQLTVTSGAANGNTVQYEFYPPIGPYTSGIVTVSGGINFGGSVTHVMYLDPVLYE